MSIQACLCEGHLSENSICDLLGEHERFVDSRCLKKRDTDTRFRDIVCDGLRSPAWLRSSSRLLLKDFLEALMRVNVTQNVPTSGLEAALLRAARTAGHPPLRGHRLMHLSRDRRYSQVAPPTDTFSCVSVPELRFRMPSRASGGRRVRALGAASEANELRSARPPFNCRHWPCRDCAVGKRRTKQARLFALGPPSAHVRT